MTDIKKILFATDFSDNANGARNMASYMQQKLGCAIEVLHVFDPRAFETPAPYYFMSGVESWLDEHLSGMRERGRTALDELCPQLEANGHFVEGKPGKVICEFANDHEADLIIMGTHGYSGWDRLVMGSVAEYVIRHAGCPVLTVKPDEF